MGDQVTYSVNRAVWHNRADLITAVRATADGAIPTHRLVKGHTDGTLIVGTLGSKRIVGANAGGAVVSTEVFNLVSGYTDVVAAEPLLAGDAIKCGDNGRALQFADADNLDTVVGTGTAGNFGNQPANDGLEIGSDSAADTTQTVTIIGTTQGGHVVVVETITLTGVTYVATTKVDWGYVLAVKLSAICAGTVTVREASGNATVTTITTGNLSAGVTAIAAAAQGCHGLAPYVKAGGASTKEVGIKYEPATGAAETYEAVALNGTSAVALTAANRISEIYLGDVATGTVATFYTNASEEDEHIKVGKAVADITAGSTGKAFLSL